VKTHPLVVPSKDPKLKITTGPKKMKNYFSLFMMNIRETWIWWVNWWADLNRSWNRSKRRSMGPI